MYIIKVNTNGVYGYIIYNIGLKEKINNILIMLYVNKNLFIVIPIRRLLLNN